MWYRLFERAWKSGCSFSSGNVEGAALVGEMVAEKALQQGVQRVVFDRNGFLYHGRVAAVATAAREKGLEF